MEGYGNVPVVVSGGQTYVIQGQYAYPATMPDVIYLLSFLITQCTVS